MSGVGRRLRSMTTPMSTSYDIGNEGTVALGSEQETVEVIDEVAEREARLRPSVEAEIQAKVDYADEWELEGRLFGQTLEAQERMAAWEWEIERTRVRWDRRADSDREARCRSVVGRIGRERRVEFMERAASVEPWLDPERADPREQLSREELGLVNREAGRMAEKLEGWSPAAVGRLVAERVVDGAGVAEAVLDVFEELRTAPGQVVPIGMVGEVRRKEVSIEGSVEALWKPTHPKIAQVGLLGDETGRVKFTVWKASRQPMVAEGERVRFRDVAKSWYEGRCSVALTGRSRILTQ